MSDSGELAPGALVTPSIRLERLLGRGGMGSVWIARHLQLRTNVVVKFMTAERAENKESQQRFRREAELAAQAKSPHVVQIFDHGISQLGIPYIAMELLEGEDLGKRIGREGKIEPRRFAEWLTQACRGLARAHAKGIVHRDIKPENIFLCENDGEVGLAQEVSEHNGNTATYAGIPLTPVQDNVSATGNREAMIFYLRDDQLPHAPGVWPLVVTTTTTLAGQNVVNVVELRNVLQAAPFSTPLGDGCQSSTDGTHFGFEFQFPEAKALLYFLASMGGSGPFSVNGASLVWSQEIGAEGAAATLVSSSAGSVDFLRTTCSESTGSAAAWRPLGAFPPP